MIYLVISYITLWLLHQWLSLYTHSMLLHRIGAHGQFILKPDTERRFFFFAWLMQGTAFLNARAYAWMHRMHHEWSDGLRDPHSPRQYHHWYEIFHFMWRTKRIYVRIIRNRWPTPAFIKERRWPTHPEFQRFAYSDRSVLMWLGIYFVSYLAAFLLPGIFLGIWLWWLWPMFALTTISSPFHGAIVNWSGHKPYQGYRNFDTPDDSSNTYLLGYVMQGETFQNNHHRYQFCPNFAWRWYEVDTAYHFSIFLRKLGLFRFKFSMQALRALVEQKKFRIEEWFRVKASIFRIVQPATAFCW